MKIIITLLLLSTTLFSCINKGVKTPKIIQHKSIYTYMRDPLPKEICRFHYDEWSGNNEWSEFIDSCDKYNIGDTIIGKSKYH
jgi:hypothetical protein